MQIYGIDTNGRVVHVDQVENGTKCLCTCPECGNQLIAKNGGLIKEHHFAHVNGCECAHANESAMHLYVKDYIAREKKLMLPAYDYEFEGGVVAFDRVESEVTFADGYRCDLVGYSDNHALYIEVFVTHEVDEKKLESVKKHGLSMVEIDIPTEGRDFMDKDKWKIRWLNAPELYRKMIYNSAKKLNMVPCRRCELIHNNLCTYMTHIYVKQTREVIPTCIRVPKK